MSDKNHKILWCIVRGKVDARPFKLAISLDEDIEDLREKISEKIARGRPLDFNPIDLILWKPKENIPLDPTNTLADRIEELGPDFLQFADEPNLSAKVALVFQNEDKPSLSVIIQFPTSDDSDTPQDVNFETPDTEAIRPEFAIKLQDAQQWKCLRDPSLAFNDIKPSASSSFVQKFVRERLQRQDNEHNDDKPIVIMAIYINIHFHAVQYLLCQPDVGSTTVEYIKNVFDLTDRRYAFEFVFQLYNFLSAAEADNKRFKEPESRLAAVKRLVDEKHSTSISAHTRKRERSKEMAMRARQRTDGKGNDYECRIYIDIRGPHLTLELLTPLKRTIRRGISQSGAMVALKTIVKSSVLQLLEYLGGIYGRSNHTIPLLDVIELNSLKTIIVLPWNSPLDNALGSPRRPGDAYSLCSQFIEGVNFLHEQRVAHCDLKPGNVVVRTSTEPLWFFIIDFVLAESVDSLVDSKETMRQGWRGTRTWVAPELGPEKGPIRWYSPIIGTPFTSTTTTMSINSPPTLLQLQNVLQSVTTGLSILDGLWSTSAQDREELQKS
ncbi:hypothetical protein BC826DRAFT_1107678 [Russula brevipes]|nr:hypothetical protein BC826DRAFT_1107678 [Russula brevipes]